MSSERKNLDPTELKFHMLIKDLGWSCMFFGGFFSVEPSFISGVNINPKWHPMCFWLTQSKWMNSNRLQSPRGNMRLKKKRRKSKHISKKPYLWDVANIDLFFIALFFFLPRWVPCGAPYDTKTKLYKEMWEKSLPYLLKCLAADFFRAPFYTYQGHRCLLLVSLMTFYLCSTTARHWTVTQNPGTPVLRQSRGTRASFMLCFEWHFASVISALSLPLLFKCF